MPPKKRRRLAASGAAPVKQGSWRPVELDLELMRAFEGAGGVFIEEADDVEGVMYFDEAASLAQEGEQKEAVQSSTGKLKLHDSKKKRRKKTATPGLASKAEPRVEAAKSLVPQHMVKPSHDEEVDAEVIAANLSAWVPYNLHPALMAGLWRLRFHTPTQVQAACLMPAILQRKDMVGAAETGSGKTLAFGLPILHHILCAAEAVAREPLGTGQQPAPSAGERELRALAVLPTRELAVQVQNHLRAVSCGTTVHTECVVGGMSSQKQRRLLRREPQVVVGTPGRLSALLGLRKEAQEERSDWLCSGLRKLRHLVLDEADRLVESGHFKELDSILGLVYRNLERPGQLQTFVFSATLTLDPRASSHHNTQGCSKVDALVSRVRFREARAVHLVDLTCSQQGEGQDTAGAPPLAADAARGSRLPERLLLHEGVCASDKEKEGLLAMWLLRRYRWEVINTQRGLPAGVSTSGDAASMVTPPPAGRVVLFVNAITSVLRLTSVLALLLESPSAKKVLSRVGMSEGKKDGGRPRVQIHVFGLHSGMKQRDRLKQIERFSAISHAVLVCTDIAARGLDVPGIGAVVHYHVPRSAEVFVHRSGRTARAGSQGESVALVGPQDSAQWNRIHRAIGVEKPRVQDICPTAFEITAAREAARLASELERKLFQTAKEKSNKTWLRRTAHEAELVLSDDDVPDDGGKAKAPRRAFWGLYQQLLARVRRPPKRLGAAPLPNRRRWR